MTDCVDPELGELADLCRRLAELSVDLDQSPRWPKRQLQLCVEHGLMSWFVPAQYGGRDSGVLEITNGLLELGKACLTTAFVMTQQIAAYKRIAVSDNQVLPGRILPGVVSGEQSATVGVSHLTTSRRHLARPALRARRSAQGYVFDGYSPWVTGAGQVDYLVTGAELDDGRQLLALIPFDTAGMSCREPADLVALSGSCTSSVEIKNVDVPDENILAGPTAHVMAAGGGGSTGGLQTSTLALSLAASACEYLRAEATKRSELADIAERFDRELTQQLSALRGMALDASVGSTERVRERANSLVLRSTQAALSAAKGAGYLRSHPAGRWCREALFFLVWSCPQSVVESNLCELAGV